MIHDGGRPSGMGIEPPAGYSALPKPGATEAAAIVVPITISDAARAVESLPMTDQRNRCARSRRRGVESASCSACRKSQTAWKSSSCWWTTPAPSTSADSTTSTVFTPDAYIDYRAMGGIDGHYPR